MTDTSKDAVDRLVLAMIRSGTMWAADTLAALAVERDAANARADAAEYRIVHIAAGLFPGGFDNNVAAIRDALRDKPAPAVTVQEVIREVWGCCEELEDEALAKLSVVKTEHEKGFWTGQKMTAKRIRRATQMPIAGGGDE